MVSTRVLGLGISSAQDRRWSYLSDHVAGAAAGLALVRHCRDVHRGTPAGPVFAGLVADIEQDEAWLRQVCDRLDVEPSRVKQAAALLGERATRAKPNGRLLGSSPLSRLVELEALCSGIAGKRSLWRSLREALPGEPLETVTLAELVERADDQHARLESIRPAIAAAALA